MRRFKVFLFKRVIIITLCVLLPYYASLRIKWKQVLNLIPEHTDSCGTKQPFTSYESKTQHQNHEHEGAQTAVVLKTRSEQFDIKTQYREGNKIKQQQQQQQMPSTRKNVIILSQGRGGSSFLGGIFNCNPQVMYWFEPLFNVGKLLNVNVFMEKEPSTYKDICLQLIDSFFKCDFSNLTKATLSELSASGFRIHSNALTSGDLCPDKPKSNKCASFKTTLLSKACSSYKHTVIKILSPRLPNNTVQSLRELFTQRNRYDVRFINLVRDPRAVVYSWVESNWIKNHSDQEFRGNVHKICDPIENNVRYGLISAPSWLKNRFKVIRYEDLVVNTTKVARKLYRYAGIDWSIDVDKWISDHQMGLSNARVYKNPYSLFKNASFAINKWKTQASKEMIRLVEDVCDGLMNIMGYSKWNKGDR
ncbi:carbohydrate sulfotransferase 3-like [Orbicella faveolata]|uniref:carbohydrate sulfotransferase 3-like n=1 Tax=Orbicella faveolata TaxID=48498 RepID=UPI0009E4C64D|nr:carbohydrate sulfotransferase 3-like [Orbicella faveolata]